MLFESTLTQFPTSPAAIKRPYNNHTQATVVTIRYKVFSAHIFRHVNSEQKTEEKGE